MHRFLGALRTKTFDCVEMKRRAQQRLHAEYEARRSEFRSYVHFLEWEAEHSEAAKAIRRKIARAEAARAGEEPR